MKSHEKLANYLAEGLKDYQSGVSILEDLDIDRDSVRFLNVKQPSSVHVNMLRKKLLHYARVHNIKPALFSVKKESKKPEAIRQPEIQKPGKIEQVMIDTNPVIRFEDLPQRLQITFKEAGNMTNEMKTMHAELKALSDDSSGNERRKWLSDNIVDLKNKIKDAWSEIDAWWAENKTKSKEQIIADEAARKAIEQQKRIKANKTYIQRNYGNKSRKEELDIRMKELDELGVDYAEDIRKAETGKKS